MKKVQKGIIIGPTKAGKTALLASLAQACNAYGFRNQSRTIALGLNDVMRSLFSQAIDIIAKGYIPFHATDNSSKYHFALEHQQQTYFWQKWTGIPQKRAEIIFMDGPGGAIFNQLNHLTETNSQFQNLKNHFLESDILLLCIDAKELHKQKQQRFYLDSLRFLLLRSYQTQVPCKRIAFVITKIDTLNTQKTQHLDAFQMVQQILGTQILKDMMIFLHPKTQFCFTTTSVLGLDGTSPSNQDHWNPHQIFETFAFLMLNQHFDHQKIYSFTQLNRLLK